MMQTDEGTKGLEMTATTRTDAGGARLEEALGHFRASVRAWSDAVLTPYAPAAASAPRPLAWRGGLAWAMGVLLAAGGASGALLEHHHQQVLAAQAQQRTLQRQRVLAAERAAEMDQLLANVDRDVSQEVPDALEPLAQMMTDYSGGK